jgi:hypothetical protein
MYSWVDKLTINKKTLFCPRPTSPFLKRLLPLRTWSVGDHCYHQEKMTKKAASSPRLLYSTLEPHLKLWSSDLSCLQELLYTPCQAFDFKIIKIYYSQFVILYKISFSSSAIITLTRWNLSSLKMRCLSWSNHCSPSAQEDATTPWFSTWEDHLVQRWSPISSSWLVSIQQNHSFGPPSHSV